LNGPEITLDRLQSQINACVFASQIFFVGEIPPEPDMPEFTGLPGDRLQKRLNQTLKSVAFVAL
jgi:hypothetical protein